MTVGTKQRNKMGKSLAVSNLSENILTPQDVVDSLQRAYKSSNWYMKSAIEKDDGGALIGIYTKRDKLRPQISASINGFRCVVYLMP